MKNSTHKLMHRDRERSAGSEQNKQVALTTWQAEIERSVGIKQDEQGAALTPWQAEAEECQQAVKNANKEAALTP